MKKKLTSRKFWLAIIGFVTALCVLFGVEDIKIEQICALISALGSIVAYIFAESYVDSKSSKADTVPDETKDADEEIELFEDNEQQNEEKI